MSVLTPEDKTFFAENGYLVVPNVVPKANCEAVVAAIFAFLGMNPDEPEDWYRLPLTNGGMIEMYQHQTLWDNRQLPKVHQIFADLYGTEKLWVTMDRVGMKPPQNLKHPEYDHKGFTHWDVDTSKLPVPFGVQGVVCLTDTDANMGGFQCIPGFHKNLEAWIATQPADRNPRMPDMTNLTVVPIPAKQGDLIIWTNILAHGNGHNVSQKPRFSQYITMHPARDDENARQTRIRCWRDRVPPPYEYFYGDPREIEQNYSQSAELTPLGRRLLGLDLWEETE